MSYVIQRQRKAPDDQSVEYLRVDNKWSCYLNKYTNVFETYTAARDAAGYLKWNVLTSNISVIRVDHEFRLIPLEEVKDPE